MKKLFAFISMTGSVLMMSLASLCVPAVILVFVLFANSQPPDITGGNLVTLLTITLAATALPVLAVEETIVLLIVLAL